MIFGVTGPNEYENNVNNNWYTNRMAAWCLEYFVETCAKLDDDRLEALQITTDDLRHMQDIADRMYYPDDRGLGISQQAPRTYDGRTDELLLLVLRRSVGRSVVVRRRSYGTYVRNVRRRRRYGVRTTDGRYGRRRYGRSLRYRYLTVPYRNRTYRTYRTYRTTVRTVRTVAYSYRTYRHVPVPYA